MDRNKPVRRETTSDKTPKTTSCSWGKEKRPEHAPSPNINQTPVRLSISALAASQYCSTTPGHSVRAWAAADPALTTSPYTALAHHYNPVGHGNTPHCPTVRTQEGNTALSGLPNKESQLRPRHASATQNAAAHHANSRTPSRHTQTRLLAVSGPHTDLVVSPSCAHVDASG